MFLKNDIQMLIASSNERFLRRFETAFVSRAIRVSVVTDGYQALTRLEYGGIDMLLLDGGNPGSKIGLKGIAEDELAHMWRQIEGRANHLVIGYVTERSCLDVGRRAKVDVLKSSMSMKLNELAAIVGSSEASDTKTPRFFLDSAMVAKNRGVDHHF
jgi:hypothetical protein